MPGVNYDTSGWQQLAQQISNQNNRLRALETQQQMILSNLQGQPIMSLGLQPGSNPPQWGLGLLRKNFAGRAAFFGEDATGAVAVKFFAANGRTVLLEVTATGLTGYNLSGTKEVQVGALGSSQYGLAVRGPTGLMQRVGGVGHGYVQTTGLGQSTTSLTWATLATPGPSVTCTIGTSGQALIMMAAYMGVAGATYNNGVYAGVKIDGTTPGGVGNPRLTMNTVRSGMGGTYSQSYMVTGLSPGSHTFLMRYEVAVSGTTGFYNTRSLVVWPL